MVTFGRNASEIHKSAGPLKGTRDRHSEYSIMRIFRVQHGATSVSISRRLFLEGFNKVDDRALE